MRAYIKSNVNIYVLAVLHLFPETYALFTANRIKRKIYHNIKPYSLFIVIFTDSK